MLTSYHDAGGGGAGGGSTVFVWVRLAGGTIKGTSRMKVVILGENAWATVHTQTAILRTERTVQNNSEALSLV